VSRKVRLIVVLHLVALTLVLAARTARVATQEQPRGMLSFDKSKDSGAEAAAHNPAIPAECRGPVSMSTDVGFEGVKTTGFNFSNTTGGGESGRFDKRPVLTTKVRLEEGSCLNAHLSAIVGSRQTYGVASITLFQVTLTPAGGAPQHMYGHYETPYGIYGPAVAIEAERDVDTLGSNFFQKVGFERGDVPPGDYEVNVWWSGGPVGGGGAIGAAFVLKLYSTRG
jgi:hypothetical protein